MLSTLTHGLVWAVVTVVACVAVGAKVCWGKPSEQILFYARDAAVTGGATVLWVWFWYAQSWLFAIAAVLWGLTLVAFIGERGMDKKYPRRAVEGILIPAFSKVIGEGWDKRLKTKYGPNNKLIEAGTSIPADTLPVDVIPGLIRVLTQDVGGFWDPEHSGRTITLKRDNDDPEERPSP